jgi:hypothetical protein
MFLKFIQNSSTILPCLEEFGASGWAWGRIVEGIIVDKLWKPLENTAPGNPEWVSLHHLAHSQMQSDDAFLGSHKLPKMTMTAAAKQGLCVGGIL